MSGDSSAQARHSRPPRLMPWGDLPRGNGLPFPQGGPHGVLVIDKPAGVTSHDVVGALRRLYGTRKVGHAGTLDPDATGILVCGLGAATRLINLITGTEKEYVARIRCGYSTDTEDASGNVGEISSPEALRSWSKADFQKLCDSFCGHIQQVPSAVSAIKVDGKRAYERFRQGENVTLSARPVYIDKCDVLDEPQWLNVHLPQELECVEFTVRVVCSPGTYIRALARDIGIAAGTFAHVRTLDRTRVGAFTRAQAFTIEQLREKVQACLDNSYVHEDCGEKVAHDALSLLPPLMSMSKACEALLPSLEVSEESATRFAHGQQISLRALSELANLEKIAPRLGILPLSSHVKQKENQRAGTGVEKHKEGSFSQTPSGMCAVFSSQRVVGIGQCEYVATRREFRVKPLINFPVLS